MPNMNPDKEGKITLEAARLLAFQQGITEAGIVQVGGKWAVILIGRSQNVALITARNEMRLFKTLETAARTVKNIGLGSVVIRLDNWSENQGEI